MVLCLGGCASSERMKRLSGNVFDEYSTPKIQRLRSEKYHHALKFAADTKMGKIDLNFNKNLINLWPFFFRSNNYISLLWPMIDFDRYGMAIRPFFNQEGDDYSILFPLSSWNVNSGFGWAGPIVWSHNSFNIVPIMSHIRNGNGSTLYYTPFYIHTWEKNKPVWSYPLREKMFLEFCLGYYSQVKAIDTEKWRWLFCSNNDIKKLDSSMRYNLNKANIPIPESSDKLARLKEDIFSKLPEKTSRVWGFFPLFHYSDNDNYNSLNIFGPLLTLRKSKLGKIAVFISKYLASYTDKVYDVPPWGLQESGEHSLILPFMGFFRCRFLCETPEVETLRNIYLKSSSQYFYRDRKSIEKSLQKFYPNLKFPDSVVDKTTLCLYLDDLCEGKEFPKFDRYVGGILPLFVYKFEPGVSNWLSLALITLSENEKENSFFFSLPLLTYKKYTPKTKIFTIAGPVIWYSKYRKEERINRPIHHRNVFNPGLYSMVEFQDDYAACALFYHGKRSFYVAKNGVNSGDVETIRKKLRSLPWRYEDLNNRVKNLQKRISQKQKWEPKNRLDELRKLLNLEEMRLEQVKLKKDQAKLKSEINMLLDLGKKLDFPVPETALYSKKEANALADKLFERFAELRAVEDYGNSLFYRKELYCNGDYNYRLLFGLAAGEKKGEKEDERILGFLYRYRKDKDKSEKIIFPFITSQTQGKDYQYSFLWRLYEKHSFNGKVGGHILFIPYGEK